MTNNNNTNIDIELIWKKINQTITEEEELMLEQWLEVSPDHQSYMDKAIQYFRDGSAFGDSNEETDKAWKIIHSKVKKSNHYNLKFIVSLAAAVVTIFMIVNALLPSKAIKDGLTEMNESVPINPGSNQALLILDDGSVHDLTASKNLILNEGGSEIKSEGSKLQYTSKNGIDKKEIKYNTLRIPRGGEFFLQLADGTKVWLNSETVLRYPVQFSDNERKVELIGEAFFEVTKNDNVPFIVESGEQTVKVLGTEFNISSYKENPYIYTTLVNGSVDVFMKNLPEIRQTLKPNEQSSINKAAGQISKRNVDPYQYVAWKEGRFVFQDQNLQMIMNTLSKWYNVEVTFKRDDLKNIRFTGNLLRYAELGEVLKKIQKTNEVKFLIENRQVSIE